MQQLKARSDERPWSLTAVVQEVLPDLFLAVDLDAPDTTYEFITEGRVGPWQNVYSFFQSLGPAQCPRERCACRPRRRQAAQYSGREAIGSDAAIRSGRKARTLNDSYSKGFSGGRNRKQIEQEPLNETHKKLWHLLGHSGSSKSRRRGGSSKRWIGTYWSL